MVFLKNNYGNWFYEYNKYLKNNKDFNDTNWANYNERFKKLYDMSSSLITDQPFGVVGNNKGFDKLIDLMGRSNYTFEDLNESLIQTYKYSLQSAMSRNTVNTHAVLFSTSMYDKKYVSSERFSNYYIIDVPFNQLHFGERDEFIRQRIEKMYLKKYNNYVDVKEFNASKEIRDILDFSIICCVNGKISNDCKIAISDKGFKFKVSWKYSYDVDFIVYKLDKCDYVSTTIDINPVSYKFPMSIPCGMLGIDSNTYNGRNCILNIYPSDSDFEAVPNFGNFTGGFLSIKGLQTYTSTMFTRYHSTKAVVEIFIPKFIKEVPDIYPAVNIYDIMDSRIVMDERNELIKDNNGKRIVSSTNVVPYNGTICTPPICIDRDTSTSFSTIVDAVELNETIGEYSGIISRLATAIQTNNMNSVSTISRGDIIDIVIPGLREAFSTYVRFTMLTSLVDELHITRFENFINKLNTLATLYNFTEQNVQSIVIGQFSDDLYNYSEFIKYICNIFDDNNLTIFKDLHNLYKGRYFNNTDSHTILRPVSEECIITLKYNRDDDCWVFNVPNIKHFNGIGNTFYINDGLKGTEIFKFFVLYSMSENPVEKPIDTFNENVVLDFDKFCTEIESYIAYIRYWDAENKLMKLSKILFNRYDDETCMGILSKMLLNKLDTDMVYQYASDMVYGDANVTTDNLDGYDEYSDRGPFSINFLFYTLSMMNNNVDKLQSYLYRNITGNKFDKRYLDMNIGMDLTDERYPISYNGYTIAPTSISSESNPSSDIRQAYYGLPMFVHDSTIDGYITGSMYNNIFNVIDSNTEFPLITTNDVDKEYYLKYNDITQHGGSVVSYVHTIRFARLLTEYLRLIYDLYSKLLTNYTTTFNQKSVMDNFLKEHSEFIGKLTDYMDEHHLTDIPGIASTNDIYEMIVDPDNPLYKEIESISKTLLPSVVYLSTTPKVDIFTFINVDILKSLERVYELNGFTDDVMVRARQLYIHLKDINKPMNCYEFKKWLLGIDIETLSILDEHIAYNPDVTVTTRFFDLSTKLSTYITNVIDSSKIDMLDAAYKSFEDFKTTFIDIISGYCNDVMTKLIFPLYKIQNIKLNTPITMESNGKPKYCLINISSVDHINNPLSDITIPQTTIIVQPIIERESAASHYVITSLSMITEYCFFSGETLTNCTMNVIGEDGTGVTSTILVDISFMQISTTADDVNTLYKIPNYDTTVFDFDNHYESFEINSDRIVNEKLADMNYELLCGNAFKTLDHESEYILTPNTWAEKCVDRVFVENQLINTMSDMEYAHDDSCGVYFKPSFVLHLNEEADGSIDSVYGKFFEGETIYLHTDDNKYIFPVKITKVDHSINKGFIEAEVDDWNSKWFKAEDNTEITKYLTTDVECTVIDDNIRNFLNEYNNSDYINYYIPPITNDVDVDMYTLPGDPIFVNINSDYVYTRLNWIFNENIQNRFIDEDHKMYSFTYVTKGFINDIEDDVIKINMINFNHDDRSLVDKYPILRSEPNDHDVWKAEIDRFNEEIHNIRQKERMYNQALETDIYRLSIATTIDERLKLIDTIDILKRRISDCAEDIKRFERMIDQLESPNTWFNIRSYDTALVYIANGRADTFSPAYIDNVRDLIYTDDVEVWLYDMEHGNWVNPATYTISSEVLDNIKVDESDDYSTNKVLYSITITPTNNFTPSRKLLVYFAFNKSNIYDDIEMNDETCFVRFKPTLALDKPITDYDPYAQIYIREHFDGFEKYKVETDSSDIHVKRIKRNGEYEYAPQFRFCDVIVEANNNVYDFNDFESVKVKTPFIGESSQSSFHTPTFTATVNVNIDEFTPDTNINLICVSNEYDGHISNIMFTGITSYDSSDNQIITITDSTLKNYQSGQFICTVFKDERYSCVGGLVTIDVVDVPESDLYNNDGWFTLPTDRIKYREVPNEFMLTINGISSNTTVTVTLKNNYYKDYSDTIDINNGNLYNMNEYYYDDINLHRLPISDTRHNDHNTRLVVDTSINTNVKIVKSPYLGICRYSCNKIPVNGLMNLTGYLPTPLSRDRYEFWVNGRCLKDENFIILSPTVIQLKNLKSLRHFECIELIDDVDSDSELFENGNVYTDINGNTYGNYKLALLSNSKISNQRIAYIFNANNNTGLQSYLGSILPNPNNHDYEEDILKNITFDDSNTDYNKLINLPSINGITLFHPTLFDLGIREVDNTKIISALDKVWKFETITNPLFMTSHIDPNDKLGIFVKTIDTDKWNGVTVEPGTFEIHVRGYNSKYMTLYVSDVNNSDIADVNHTKKIIPFVSSGDYILLDKSYRGMWICSTDSRINPTLLN